MALNKKRLDTLQSLIGKLEAWQNHREVKDKLDQQDHGGINNAKKELMAIGSKHQKA